jgi:hypothetical protein
MPGSFKSRTARACSGVSFRASHTLLDVSLRSFSSISRADNDKYGANN